MLPMTTFDLATARRNLISQRSRLGAHTPAGYRILTLIGQLKARASGRHGPDLDKRIRETMAELDLNAAYWAAGR
jgi:hypothetical protein